MPHFLSSFYIFETQPLSDVELMEIFSHFVGCHSILSAVFFALQKSFENWKVVHGMGCLEPKILDSLGFLILLQ